MKIKILLGILALSIQAHAGGMSDVGGGGRALVCFDNPSIVQALYKDCISKKNMDPQYSGCGTIPDSLFDKIQSIETYDLFEARQPRLNDKTESSIYALKPNFKYFDYAKDLAHAIAPYSEEVSDQILRGTGAFSEENIIFQQRPLIDQSDSKELISLDNDRCMLSTVATQYRSGEANFLQIDSRLFNHPKHSELSKAVLFLHEALYQRVRSFQKDSRNTRSMVALLLRNDKYQTVENFQKTAQSLGFIKDRLVLVPQKEFYYLQLEILGKAQRMLQELYTSPENLKEFEDLSYFFFKAAFRSGKVVDSHYKVYLDALEASQEHQSHFNSYHYNDFDRFILAWNLFLNGGVKFSYNTISDSDHIWILADFAQGNACNKLGRIAKVKKSGSSPILDKLEEASAISYGESQYFFDSFKKVFEGNLLFKKQSFDLLVQKINVQKEVIKANLKVELQKEFNKRFNNYETLYSPELKSRLNLYLIEEVDHFFEREVTLKKNKEEIDQCYDVLFSPALYPTENYTYKSEPYLETNELFASSLSSKMNW